MEINDKVFGKMVYNHRWERKDTISFWEQNHEINIVAKAFSGKPINEVQRNNYLLFKKNIEIYSKNTKLKAIEYVKQNIIEINETIGLNVDMEKCNINDLIFLKSVIFSKNDEIYMICDCIWDEEEGLGIGIKPDVLIAPLDYFL